VKVLLHVWRQAGPAAAGKLVDYEAHDISADMSFLEMLDVVNERLISKGEVPIAFDHDCREGICGSCGMMINGAAHGPMKQTTACQLHMRSFRDGDEIWIEPWRAKAFPVIKDLVVNRGAFDRIIQAGGFVSAPTGSAQDGNAIPIAKHAADACSDWSVYWGLQTREKQPFWCRFIFFSPVASCKVSSLRTALVCAHSTKSVEGHDAGMVASHRSR